MSKKDAAVYLEAARMIAEQEEECSCLAIDMAVSDCGIFTAQRKAFHQQFKPSRILYYAWGGQWGETRRHCRILALLFAAAMAEAGDL